MARIRTDVVLSQIAELEPVAFSSIVCQAKSHPLGVTRWRRYERLKHQAAEIVGWSATHPELATSEHYEAMIGFIDELLPQAQEDDTSDYDDMERQQRQNRDFVPFADLVNDFMTDLEQKWQRRQKEGQAG